MKTRLGTRGKRKGVFRKNGIQSGQVDVVASLLIICIMVILMVIAYTWGMPLIARSESKTRMDYAVGFMGRVADNIESVSYAPGSQRTIQGRIMRGRLELTPRAGKASPCDIMYELDSETQFFALNLWMPQNDPNYYINKSRYGAPDIPGIGVYGLNRPAVLWGMSRVNSHDRYGNILKLNGSTLFANQTAYDYVIYNITCEKQEVTTGGLFDLTVMNQKQTITNAEQHNNLTIHIVMSMR